MKKTVKKTECSAGRVIYLCFLILFVILTLLSSLVFFVNRFCMNQAMSRHSVPHLFGTYYLSADDPALEEWDISFAQPGDLLLLQEKPVTEVKPGMVCLYEVDYASEDPNKIQPTVALSSVMAKDAVEYKMKNFADPDSVVKILPTDVFAVATSRLSHLGSFVTWMQQPYVVFVMVLGPVLLLILLFFLFFRFFSKKKKASPKTNPPAGTAKPPSPLMRPSNPATAPAAEENAAQAAESTSSATQIKSETVSTLRDTLYDADQLKMFYPDEDDAPQEKVSLEEKNALTQETPIEDDTPSDAAEAFTADAVMQETVEFDLQEIKRKMEQTQPKPVAPTHLSKVEIDFAEDEVNLHFNDDPKEDLKIQPQKDGIVIETPHYEATVSINLRKKD